MSRLQKGVNDLKTWCLANGEFGEQLISEWTGEVDNKTLTAQLAELENIKDKDALDKKLMEFNIQNRNYDVE